MQVTKLIGSIVLAAGCAAVPIMTTCAFIFGGSVLVKFMLLLLFGIEYVLLAYGILVSDI